ncbi:MAG: hypothetical protein GY806_11865 [Gammaproteobacteria bacterium]|nr:hypothetical protein [Gammaproteobacteria bacterium]
MARSATLVRKQVLLSTENIEKLETVANKRKSSVAEVVRNAIDYFDPEGESASEANELLEVASKKLKEAISDTQKTRRHLNKTLKKIESGSQ